MSDAKPSWFSRLFNRGRSDATNAPASTSHGAAQHELPVSGATVGLCFDYERDLCFDSAELSDTGLAHILSVLKARQLRATFNCAAKLCEEVGHQIRTIADAGHELAVYGYAGESWANLDAAAIKALVYRCRSAFSRVGLSPIGFRSKSTQCNETIARELALQRFRYNSQHDHAKHPYILIAEDPAFVRIPVATDDRGFVRGKNDAYQAANEVISKHDRYLRKAIVRKHFVSIAFHPWILAEEPGRMSEWENWIDTAVKGGARVGALEDALPAAYRHFNPIEDPADDDE